MNALHNQCTYVWVGCKNNPQTKTTTSVIQLEIITTKSFCHLDHGVEAGPHHVDLFFTQSSWRYNSWFPLNKPPTGCLNRPLINPSVGSLLRPKPSEQGSHPAKQRMSSCREGECIQFQCPLDNKQKKLCISHL